MTATNNGVVKVLAPSFYTADDIAEMLGVSKNNAYKRIKELRAEFKDQGYSPSCCPAGKIPIWFFNQRSGLGGG